MTSITFLIPTNTRMFPTDLTLAMTEHPEAMEIVGPMLVATILALSGAVGGFDEAPVLIEPVEGLLPLSKARRKF